MGHATLMPQHLTGELGQSAVLSHNEIEPQDPLHLQMPMGQVQADTNHVSLPTPVLHVWTVHQVSQSYMSVC